MAEAYPKAVAKACFPVCSMLFSSVLWLTASGRAPPGRQGSADLLFVC